MPAGWPLRFGAFFAPFHPVDQKPTLALELYSREVIPHFTGQLEPPQASHQWAVAHRQQLFGKAGEAILHAITEHVEDKTARATYRDTPVP